MMAVMLKSSNLNSAILPQKNFTHSFWLNLMMAAILNSAILDSAISTKKTSLIHSHSTWWWQPSWILLSWIQPFCTKSSLVHSDSTLLMEAILKSAILDSAICTKKNFTHAFSLNLMMATILDSAILDSAILHKTLTQTSSIWLKLIHSHSTWWYQSSWILPSWIQYTAILDSNTLLSSLRFTQKHSSSTLTLTQLIPSD